MKINNFMYRFIPYCWIKVIDTHNHIMYIGRTLNSVFKPITLVSEYGETVTFDNWHTLSTSHVVTALKINSTNESLGVDYSKQLLSQLN